MFEAVHFLEKFDEILNITSVSGEKHQNQKR